MRAFHLSALAALVLLPSMAVAQTVSIAVNKITDKGVGERIGTIAATGTKQGISFIVEVRGLSAGSHGFHIHEKGDCNVVLSNGKPVAGGSAGDHWDPGSTKSHQGPGKGGHRGDLPVLELKENGTPVTVNVDGLEISDIAGRAIVIHEGGDNFTDQPANGGGGARIACGVIPKP